MTIRPNVLWTNASSSAVWVEPNSRDLRIPGCGILAPGKTKELGDQTAALENPGTIVWRLQTEPETALRTNSLNVSAIPPGNHRGTLVLELTTDLTWRALLAAE